MEQTNQALTPNPTSPVTNLLWAIFVIFLVIAVVLIVLAIIFRKKNNDMDLSKRDKQEIAQEGSSGEED